MGKQTIFAEHGGCTLEDPDTLDYQCICKYDQAFTTYQYLWLSVSVITFLTVAYLLFEIRSLAQKRKGLLSLLKLKILSLFVILFSSTINILYFSIDPHLCKRKINAVVESVFYGMGICLPAILLLIIILRWLDLLKLSFTREKNKLFNPMISKLFYGIIFLVFLIELVCRIFWGGPFYYVYSIWGCLYIFFCFFGFSFAGTKLNRKLLYGAKLSGSLDPRRKSQIKQIYVVALSGSVICILIFFESLMSMLIHCFSSQQCSMIMEYIWKVEEYVIFWLYIILAWKGNKQFKNPQKVKIDSNKSASKIELVEKKSDSEDKMESKSQNKSVSVSGSESGNSSDTGTGSGNSVEN
ncbi:hypothetical protein M0813_21742 [Anaeramoeba flamelloides]|uniref:THH1/TOM1/TOM3 domain-containing protein n=1 Tax=Anaeramoeba flamelloides TaxID=1746091 RepID=A0ABQ8YH85_9EUKA|nr:hypothetical protein M0813_21742 [Anaeramoeba flamelloides]